MITALETALQAARLGLARSVAITIVTPLHEVETAIAGELDGPTRLCLIGGLSSAAHKLIDA